VPIPSNEPWRAAAVSNFSYCSRISSRSANRAPSICRRPMPTWTPYLLVAFQLPLLLHVRFVMPAPTVRNGLVVALMSGVQVMAPNGSRIRAGLVYPTPAPALRFQEEPRL
jgi:hypothetical protein